MIAPVEPAALLLGVLPWVRRLAHQHARRYDLDADEVVQESAVLFLRFADRFDPARGSITSWTFTVVRSTVARMISRRVSRRGQPRPSLPEFPLADPRQQSPADLAAVAEHRSLDEHRLRRYLRGLAPKERQVVCRLYGIGRRREKVNDIARDLGVSRQRVYQVAAKAIRGE